MCVQKNVGLEEIFGSKSITGPKMLGHKEMKMKGTNQPTDLSFLIDQKSVGNLLYTLKLLILTLPYFLSTGPFTTTKLSKIFKTYDPYVMNRKIMIKLRRQPNSAEKNKLQRVNSTPIDTQKVEQQSLRKMVKIFFSFLNQSEKVSKLEVFQQKKFNHNKHK